MIRQPCLILLRRDVNYTIVKLSRIEAGVIAQGFPPQIVFYCYILNGYANNMNRSVLYYYHNSPRNTSIFSHHLSRSLFRYLTPEVLYRTKLTSQY